MRLGGALLAGVFLSVICSAQDIKVNVTYVCNGERIYAESCNIRDTSDTSTCMVAHPDRPLHNGFMVYTYETRGALKKLLPTCKQPSAQELAAADAFQKKQQSIYDANVAKANPQPSPAASGGGGLAGGGGGPVGQIAPPKDAEERAMRRCVSSGRLPATCTGNSLLGAFGQMISSVLPSAGGKEPTPGPEMAGVFQGADNWRLDFIDGGVLVNCAFLSPNQESYSLAFKSTGAVLTIDTTPKPLVLAIHSDGTITGPGPVTIDGVVATGTASSGPDPNASSGYTDQNGISLTNSQAASSSEVYQGASRHYGPVASGGGSYTTFAPRRATCPALNLTSKGAGTGVQTMETNLLKSVFSDGDTGPPTPVGIRMHGIFAASSGFSAQFFPESVVLGCGPDAARAYPYTVVASGSGATIKVDVPDHPLTMPLRADGSIDAGSGPYQVHGRIVTGQNDDGDFTFAPMEETCNLALLTPSKEIPSSGGVAGTVATMATASSKGSGLSTPQAPLGNATLSVVSGIPAQQGVPNPLAGHPYVLLRDSYGDALAKGGVSVPQGVSPYKYVGQVCAAGKTPDCQTILNAINVNAASAVRADENGSGTMPGVPPGMYYLMISMLYNNRTLVWGQAVQLKAGANSVTLNPRDATPIN
jgi:hypothetical protein